MSKADFANWKFWVLNKEIDLHWKFLLGNFVRLNKKKNVLSQSSRPHSFFFAHPFVLNWQFWFFSSIFLFLTFFLGQNLAIFLQIWRIKMEYIINYRDPLSDGSLVSFRLPSLQSSAPFRALQTNCTGRQWSQQVVKKNKQTKHIPHPIMKPWRALRQNIIFFFFSLI